MKCGVSTSWGLFSTQKNELLSYTKTCMCHQRVTLSEKGQFLKVTCCVNIVFTYNIIKMMEVEKWRADEWLQVFKGGRGSAVEGKWLWSQLAI